MTDDSTTDTSDWIADIEARVKAATEGEWDIRPEVGWRTLFAVGVFGTRSALAGFLTEADAVLIAHCKTDLTRLIARVRELEGALAHIGYGPQDCPHCHDESVLVNYDHFVLLCRRALGDDGK